MSDPASFTFAYSVAAEDIDRLGHVNNVVYVKIVQDAAVKHWFHLAPPDVARAVIWVCRRHELDYLKPAFLGDELRVKTWVGSPSGATWERFTEITRPTDGATVLKARTVWVLVDATSLRPRRVDAAVMEWFGGPGRTAATPES
jgi:acyl-CoA thioester hydrolase